MFDQYHTSLNITPQTMQTDQRYTTIQNPLLSHQELYYFLSYKEN